MAGAFGAPWTRSMRCVLVSIDFRDSKRLQPGDGFPLAGLHLGEHVCTIFRIGNESRNFQDLPPRPKMPPNRRDWTPGPSDCPYNRVVKSGIGARAGTLVLVAVHVAPQRALTEPPAIGPPPRASAAAPATPRTLPSISSAGPPATPVSWSWGTSSRSPIKPDNPRATTPDRIFAPDNPDTGALIHDVRCVSITHHFTFRWSGPCAPR